MMLAKMERKKVFLLCGCAFLRLSCAWTFYTSVHLSFTKPHEGEAELSTVEEAKAQCYEATLQCHTVSKWE